MLGGPKEVMGEVLLQKKWLALTYYLFREDRSRGRRGRRGQLELE